MDDKSPEINSDPDDFQSLEDYERTPESSRSVEMEHMGNLEVNPPRPDEHSPSDDEDDVNLENFRVEFGGGAQDQPDSESPPLVSDVEEVNEDLEQEEDTSNLYLSVGVDDNEQEENPENQQQEVDRENQEPTSYTREDEKLEPSADLNLDTEEQQVEVEEEEPDDQDVDDNEEDDEPSSSSVPFHSGSLGTENVLETREVEIEVEDEDDVVKEVGEEDRGEEEEKPEIGDDEESEEEEETEMEPQKDLDLERGDREEVEEENLTSRSIGKKRGRPRFVSGDIDKSPESDPSRGLTGQTREISSSRTDTDRQKGFREQQTRDRSALPSATTNAALKSRKYMTPGAVIYNYERGRLSRREAFEILQEAKRSKMLHKSTDKVYIDKEGDVRIPRGYSFGKSRTSEGKVRRKRGLTRIDREIQAYQKSTHMLIPRAIFARIVREIAQGWFKGEGQIKFTVEALAALQTAAEDEMVRLLETSMVCSRHAKRITLRVEDVRLARFCRGRQLYEFSNMEM